MKRIAFVISALLLVATPRAAQAQSAKPFGERAHTVIVVDNLAGAMHSSFKLSNDSSSSSGTSNTADDGITGIGTSSGVYALSPISRFGVHQFVGGGVSLGLGVHWSYHSASLSGPGGTTLLGLSPRIGFAIPLNDTTALWLRVGVTYLHYDYSGVLGASEYDVMPGGELFLVYTPVPHFGITFGPTAEIGVAGKFSFSGSVFGNGATPPDLTVRRKMYGLSVGFLFDL